MYYYFIVYWCADGNSRFLGNTEIKLASAIESKSQIRLLEEFISRQFEVTGVVITNFILLRIEED